MFHFHGLRFRSEESLGPDVNSTAGFTEALAAAAGHELSDEERESLDSTPDRDVSSGLTTESQTPEPVVTEPVVPETAAVPPVEGAAPEPDAQEPGTEFEQGYLRALGEQAEKIGEERAKREALEARLAAIEEGTQESAPEHYFPDADTMDRLVERFDEVGGHALMSYVANSEPENLPAAMALWKAGGDPDVAAAHLYEERVQALVNEGQQSAQPVAAELPPELVAVAQERKMAATFGSFASELGKERAAALAPHVDAAIAEAGPLVQAAIAQAVSSDDPAQHRQAFNTVVTLAEAHAKAQPPAAVTEAQQAVRRTTRQAAQVNNGSRRTVSPGQSGGNELPTSQAEFAKLSEEERRVAATKLVADQFEKTETTSVQAGLTYGK